MKEDLAQSEERPSHRRKGETSTRKRKGEGAGEGERGGREGGREGGTEGLLRHTTSPGFISMSTTRPLSAEQWDSSTAGSIRSQR